MNRRAATLLVIAAALLGAAIWFAAGWVEDPPDETCGSLFGTHWLHRDSCRPVMLLRLTIALGMTTMAILVCVRAWRAHTRRAGGR